MKYKMPVYQCPECGMHYLSEGLAKQCEEFCKTYKMCSLEIAQQAIENEKGN